ncbi:MAG: CHRD domain-containing protein [Xenophilus sp.]
MSAQPTFLRSFMPPAACRGAGAAVLAAVLAGCTSVSLDEPPSVRRNYPSYPQTPAQPPVETVPAVPPVQATPVPPPAPMSSVPAPERDPQLAAFSTRLDGRNEAPPVYSMGTGTLDAVLNRNTGLLRFRIGYSNLSGPITAAHFHGPAEVGANAAPVITLNPPFPNPYEGRVQLTPVQAADLLAGRWYLNLHTAQNPGGELRGQLIERR